MKPHFTTSLKFPFMKGSQMANIKFFSGRTTPIEMHRVRIIQKLNLLPIEERYKAIKEAETILFC